jgi:predicted nucleic acid-binding protein
MIALADTSLFIARETGRPLRAAPPEEVAVSVVTVGELRLGVLMAGDLETRDRRLATLQLARSLEPLPIDEAVADAWAGLVARLREEGRRMPINDSWIAATALAGGMAVATQDDDYDPVPGLEVIKL